MDGGGVPALGPRGPRARGVVCRGGPLAHGGVVYQPLPGLLGAEDGGVGGGVEGGQGTAPPDPEQRHRLWGAALSAPRGRGARGTASPARGGGEFQLPGAAGPDAVGIVALSTGPRIEWPAAKPLREAPSPARCEWVGGRGPAASGLDLQPAGPSVGHGGAVGTGVSGGLGGPHCALPVARGGRL